MLKMLLFILLLPVIATAQLREFEVGEMPRPDVAVVQGDMDFPDDALILVYSSIRGLNFRSSLDAIDKVSFNPTANRYEILVKPLKQMVFVYHQDFMEGKISTINPNGKDVLYYKVEEKKQEVVSTEPGTLKITTEPSGADIFINGTKIAEKTPFTGEFNTGSTRVKLQKIKHETIDTLIAVRSGQTTVLSVPLRPTALLVNISSTPSGADITLDGTSRGKTPASFELDLMDGSKRGSKSLRLTLSDHETLSTTLDLRPSATPLDLKYTLTKQKGSFSITSTPAGAQVFIGGQLKGTTPLQGSMEVGRYEVEAKLEGYTVPKQDMLIKVGAMASLSFVMTNSSNIIRKIIDDMVRIEGGKFMMGCTPGDIECQDNEKPARMVRFSTFNIGKYEITQEQWRAVIGSNPPELYNKGCDKCPVEQVSWNDITNNFLPKLNRLTGKTFRLPTEAEWEYAARGGVTSRFHTGNCLSTDEANFNGNFPAIGCDKGAYREKTIPVGSFAPNKFGLYDMSGNVFEWCSDWIGAYKNNAVSNPSGPSVGSYRVLRGGGWYYYGANSCRVSNRWGIGPNEKNALSGFRIVLP